MYSLVIAEDEEIVRRGLMQGVRWAKYGFTPRGEAAGGQAALDLVRSLRPELLVTDIRMPDMNGLELLRRAKLAYPLLEVVIISAYDLFAYAQEAVLGDAAGYLLKPVEGAALDAVMEKVLSRLARGGPRDAAFSGAGARNPGPEGAGEPEDIAERARRYITTHYADRLTLEDVAETCYTNPSYLSTVFKNRMGCGFVDYIAQIRVREAKLLLDNSSYKVSYIAARVGYEDYTYFCKVFKKVAGCTPLAYRCRTR